MLGVIVLALGLAKMFSSLDEGNFLNLRVMVAGYVVMRVPMIFLWARAARHDPARRPAATTYIWTISVAQVFWVLLAIAQPPIAATFVLLAVFVAVEMLGPFLAERRKGGTPWHAHHIAERYGLLVIITLGEGVIGTVASINAVVNGDAGWTLEAGVVAFAGIGLIFGTWWTYFVIPWAEVLERHRERAFLWSYGHLVIFAALAAIGAGLHVAASFIDNEATISATGTVASTALPFAIYTVALYAIYARFTRNRDPFHLALLAGTATVLALSLALAALGAGVAICLVVLMFAPVVAVVGYETVGHRHVAAALRQMT
jgi:low temperature requirement protein LtrA